MAYELPLQIWLHRPGAETVGELGTTEVGGYTRIFAKARLVQGAGVLGEVGDIVQPVDQRKYIVRHLDDINNRWFLEDSNGDFFGVKGWAPLPAGRRKGHIMLNVEFTTRRP